jgi:hypothetical protein
MGLTPGITRGRKARGWMQKLGGDTPGDQNAMATSFTGSPSHTIG